MCARHVLMRISKHTHTHTLSLSCSLSLSLSLFLSNTHTHTHTHTHIPRTAQHERLDAHGITLVSRYLMKYGRRYIHARNSWMHILPLPSHTRRSTTSWKTSFRALYIFCLCTRPKRFRKASERTGPCVLIKRNPPPGVGLFYMFHDQTPGGKGPPWKHMVQILRGGSSSYGFLIREHSK